MTNTVTLAIVAVVAASISSAALAASNDEMAPIQGRVPVGTKGALTRATLACPQPGAIRMALSQKDKTEAAAVAAGFGCFDLSVGDQVTIEEGMPNNQTSPSHVCVRVTPQQAKCVWILNVGIKAENRVDATKTDTPKVSIERPTVSPAGKRLEVGQSGYLRATALACPTIDILRTILKIAKEDVLAASARGMGEGCLPIDKGTSVFVVEVPNAYMACVVPKNVEPCVWAAQESIILTD